jgi:hypothetical protein
LWLRVAVVVVEMLAVVVVPVVIAQAQEHQEAGHLLKVC